MSRYLISCSQGHSIEISRSQAGLLVSCQCGEQVQVPALREINRLKVVEDSKAAPQRKEWSIFRGLKWLGGVMLVVGLGLAITILMNFPEPPTWEMDLRALRQDLEPLGISDSMKAWEETTESVDLPVEHYLQPDYLFRREVAVFYMGTFTLVAIVGAGLLFCGFFWGKPAPSSGTPR